MVKHIVLWDLREDLSPEEQREAALGIKTRLEALKDSIEGIVSAQVHTEMIDTCNTRVVLETVFTDEAHLRAYIVHPDHKLAGTYVKSKVVNKRSADFEL